MNAIIALTSDAYERVLARLEAGEEFVKTFRNVCPHAKSPDKCKCPFYKNILVNEEIMREVDGKLVKIYNLAEVMKR